MKVQPKNDSTEYYLEFLCQKYNSQNPKELNNTPCAKNQYAQSYTNSTIKNRPTK